MNSYHVSKFSPNGKLFAFLNEIGILKIWDTETNELKQEYTPNLHLAGPCTSLTWLIISHHKKAKKSRKSVQNESNESLYIALGTSKGGVAIYSYANGQVEKNLKGDGHSGKVTNLTYDDEDLLYTCGEDWHIIVWSISNEKRIASWSCGSNEIPFSIAYLYESKQILIGARQLKLFSVENQELVQTFTGHTSEIILLNQFVYNDIEYIISASKMERILCLWKMTSGNGSTKKIKNSSCTLLMEDIAQCLSCKMDTENCTLKVAAVTRSGVIHVYEILMDNIRAEKPIKPKVTIKIASDSVQTIEPIPAVTASLKFGLVKKELRFGFGDNQFLIFEDIMPDFNENIQVLIRTNPKKLLTKNIIKKQSEKILKSVTPIISENDVEYQTSTTLSKKKQKSIQIPMETRLQNLHLSNGEIPQAQSKVQLLVQSLHSKDANLLRTVLSTDDPKVINLTLQKLPVQYVGSLVNELTLLMERKRLNVQIAANWLTVLIKAHSSQLMAMGSTDLLQKFGPCLGIIEHRTNCIKELSKLNGRLQLLVSQIKRNTEEDYLNNENVLVYEDEDSSNSEIEIENEDKSISDDDWAEDDEDEELDEEMES